MGFPTVQANISDLKQSLATSEVDAGGSGAQMSFLSFAARRNAWEYGRDKEDVSGQILHINAASFVHGWVLWSQRKCTKVMASIMEPMPQQPEPKQKPNGQLDYPSEGRGFQGKWEDSDEIVSFESGTLGGKNAVNKVIAEVKRKAVAGSDYIFPKVELNSYSYTNNNGDEVFSPVLDIVGWTDQDGNEETNTPKLEPRSRKA